jgi:hypothetical protein
MGQLASGEKCCGGTAPLTWSDRLQRRAAIQQRHDLPASPFALAVGRGGGRCCSAGIIGGTMYWRRQRRCRQLQNQIQALQAPVVAAPRALLALSAPPPALHRGAALLATLRAAPPVVARRTQRTIPFTTTEEIPELFCLRPRESVWQRGCAAPQPYPGESVGVGLLPEPVLGTGPAGDAPSSGIPPQQPSG